jgi:hypothetical protein
MAFNPYYVTLLTFFAIVAYMVAMDKNVADFIVLVTKFVQLQFSRWLFMAKTYPRLRYETFLLKRKMGGISKKHLNAAEEMLSSIKMDKEQQDGDS